MKLLRRTTLHFQQGSSDKLYEVDIIAVDAAQHLVNFRYGRRGKNLTEGSKTPNAVSLQQAETIANSLLVSKINDGYQVIQGYDPISKTTLGNAINPILQAAPTATKPNTRAEKMLARLKQFALGPRSFTSFNKAKTIGYIDGYSLTRTIWKAGELRIAGLVEVLQSLLASKPQYYGEAKVLYYSIGWALARSRDPQAFHVLSAIREQIPEHLYQFALLQIAPNPQNYLPAWNTVDLPALHEAIQAFNHAQSRYLMELTPPQRQYFEQVVQHHGLSVELKQLLEQLSLTDLDTDYLKRYLSPETQLKLSLKRAAYPELEPAIDDVFTHKKNMLVDQACQSLKANFSRYQTALKGMVWPDNVSASQRGYAENGRVDWVWDRALEPRLKQLINANGISRKDLSQYAEIQAYRGKDLSPERLDHCHNILKTHGADAEIAQALTKIDTYRAYLPYVKSALSDALKSRFDKDLPNAFTRLAAKRFIELRHQAAQQTQQQIQAFNQHILGLYALTQIDVAKRANFLKTLDYVEVEQSFNATFRQVYKLAELLDDFEVLAHLNHRLELGQTYIVSGVYGHKPFSQNTQIYFKRRMARQLTKTAKFYPALYPQLARQILLLADDQAEYAVSFQGATPKLFPKLHALNVILHQHSEHYRPNYINEWQLFSGKTADLIGTEAYPKLWQQAPLELLNLLQHCQAELVNDFAYRQLQKKTAFLAEQPLSVWMELVQRPYENTATLAAQYLVPQLQETGVWEVLVKAQFTGIRKLALEQLTAQHFQASQALLVTLLSSPYEDVYQVAKDYLYTAQNDYPALIVALIDHLIAAPESTQSILIPRFTWLLTHPLAGQTPLAALQHLLAQNKIELQRLAANLLAQSKFSFTELAPCFEFMAQSSDSDLQAGAVALLAKLTDAEKADYLPVILVALLDENASLRAKALDVMASIQDPSLQQRIWETLVPELFKAEPVDGFNADLLKAVHTLSAIYPNIDDDLVWRLMNAQSALAQQAGALILPTRHAAQFSIKQLAMLTKNPSLSTRNWAMNALQQDPERVMQDFGDAVRMLDNRWDDTRHAAIQLLTQLPTAFWTPATVVMVCDQVYVDVQHCGRDLMLQAYQQGDGETYLLHLSQHPSLVVQQFVADFLVHTIQPQAEVIIKLAPYFQTVLMQMNRARLIKDRVIAFLFQQAQADENVAKMVAELFTEQSLTRVLTDRSQYLKTLVELQTRYATPSRILTIIQPELRAY
ncbi:MAG: hypothetical protein WBP46_16090 [Thiolinea sp.]